MQGNRKDGKTSSLLSSSSAIIQLRLRCDYNEQVFRFITIHCLPGDVPVIEEGITEAQDDSNLIE